MIRSQYQLYAFEYLVQDIDTCPEVNKLDLEAEVHLFQQPPVILKPGPITSASVKPALSEYGSLLYIRNLEDSSIEPFQLNMKSLTASVISDHSVHEDENEGQSDLVSEAPRKLLGKAKDGAPTKLDSDPNKRLSSSGINLDQVGQEAPSQQKNKENPSLRMFPENPKGMPYYKVRKASGEPDDSGILSVTKMQENPLQGQKGKEKKEPEKGNAKKKKGDKKEEAKPKIPESSDKRVEAKPKKPDKKAGKGKKEKGKDTKEKQKKEKEVIEKPKIDEDIAPEEASEENIEYEENEHVEVFEELDNSYSIQLFEVGCTIILPMSPLKMIHNLQRMPLKVRILDKLQSLVSETKLDLSPLYESVIVAERGAPGQIAAVNKLILKASGDFNADIYCIVKLHAFGVKAVTVLPSPGYNPNQEMNHEILQKAPVFEEVNKDVRIAPAMVSSPEHVALDITETLSKKNIVEEYPPSKKDKTTFFAEDVVYCPEKRQISPKPTDDYATMKWKIHRMLGLTDVSIQEFKEEEDDVANAAGDVPDNSLLGRWKENKRINLYNRAKESENKRNRTRSVLQKILSGMNRPDSINLESTAVSAPIEGEAPGIEQPASNELTKMKNLYKEIQRQQYEQKMIKYYKRLFRKMLRLLEGADGVKVEEQRRREKERKYMKDLLETMEKYPPNDIEQTYIQVMRARNKDLGLNVDLDLWPDLLDDGEEEEMDYYT